MKLILLDGGPASGKNTLGNLLIQKFQTLGNKAILLDLDDYVEKLCPSWIWENKQKEGEDQEKAREDFAIAITKYLQQDFITIAIGERFIIKDEITNFLNRLKPIVPIYLYHLSVPLSMRKQRLAERGPHSLIDLKKDQKERDSNAIWHGYVYKNINSPEIDAENLFRLIQDNQGLLEIH